MVRSILAIAKLLYRKSYFTAISTAFDSKALWVSPKRVSTHSCSMYNQSIFFCNRRKSISEKAYILTMIRFL